MVVDHDLEQAGCGQRMLEAVTGLNALSIDSAVESLIGDGRL